MVLEFARFSPPVVLIIIFFLAGLASLLKPKGNVLQKPKKKEKNKKKRDKTTVETLEKTKQT